MTTMVLRFTSSLRAFASRGISLWQAAVRPQTLERYRRAVRLLWLFVQNAQNFSELDACDADWVELECLWAQCPRTPSSFLETFPHMAKA